MTASIISGDNDSVLSSYSLGTDKNIKITNTSTSGEVLVNLGTNTTATEFAIKDSTDTDVFSVKGDGTLTYSGSGGSTGGITDYISIQNLSSNLLGTVKGVIPGSSGTYAFMLGLSGETTLGSNNWQKVGSSGIYIQYTGSDTKVFYFSGTVTFNNNTASQYEQYELRLRKNAAGANLSEARGRGSGPNDSTSTTLTCEAFISMANGDNVHMDIKCRTIGGNSSINWHTIRLIVH